MKRLFMMLLVSSILLMCSACIQIYPSEVLSNRNNANIPSVPDQYEHTQNIKEDTSSADGSNNSHAEVQSYCDQLVSQGDALSAYLYIKDMADENPVYGSLVPRYARIYVQDVLAEAKSCADESNYQQAIDILNEGNRIYNCSEFSDNIEMYEAFLPKKLTFAQQIDSEDYEYMLNAEDCFGNKYQEVFGFSESLASNDGGYVVYYLNGKYHNLSGVFVGSNELFKDMEVQCKIFADDVMIYESTKIGKTDPPVNINLDITGVSQLRLEYQHYSWWTTDPCCIFDLTVS